MAHFHENWTKWHFEGTFWPLFAIYMPGGPRKSTPNAPKLINIFGWSSWDFGKNAEKMRKMRKNAEEWERMVCRQAQLVHYGIINEWNYISRKMYHLLHNVNKEKYITFWVVTMPFIFLLFTHIWCMDRKSTFSHWGRSTIIKKNIGDNMKM